MAQDYNGWANRNTWNVALWLNNDEIMYRTMQKFMKYYFGNNPYKAFIAHQGMKPLHTPDGVSYVAKDLAHVELNDMMYSIR